MCDEPPDSGLPEEELPTWVTVLPRRLVDARDGIVRDETWVVSTIRFKQRRPTAQPEDE
jgi:hypothetical protein